MFVAIGQHILITTVTGEEARRFEHESDDVILEEAMQVLYNLFGDDIPIAHDILPTRWGVDSLFQGLYTCRSIYWRIAKVFVANVNAGSYSNWPMGVTRQDFTALQAPVERLLFAGSEGVPMPLESRF